MKFINKLQKHYGWIIFIVIVGTISGIITILTGINGIGALYTETIGKRVYEQKIINQLSTTVNISYFKEKLGAEVIRFEQEEGLWQHIFKRYTYYIQAITDDAGTVLFWSVTGCNSKKPLSIKAPRLRERNNQLNNIDSLNKITLHKDTFNIVFDDKKINPKLFYSLSGATANSHAVESYHGGNPSLYQTVYIGINDACSDEVEKMYELTDTDSRFINGVELDKIDNKEIVSFRKSAIINLYAETAPGFDIEKLITEDYFSVGPDRIMLRVIR